jgi:hypothetical protein
VIDVDRAVGGTRTERDSLGDFEVPADAYYGIHTARALENFRATGSTIGQFGKPRIKSWRRRERPALARGSCWSSSGHKSTPRALK